MKDKERAENSIKTTIAALRDGGELPPETTGDPVDESKQFDVSQVAKAWWSKNFLTITERIHDKFHDSYFACKGFDAGAESQRQVGPCGKHPLACWEEEKHVGGPYVSSCKDCTAPYCCWCASEQALRAEIAARDATIAARDSEIQELILENEEWVRIVESNRKEIVERDGELTEMVDRWRSQGSQTSINASGRRNCANDLAALLAKKAVR